MRIFKKVAIILTIALSALFSNCIMDPSEEGNLVPKTVMDDPSLPAITVNGARLHYESRGSGGTNIIILHGGPGFDYRSLLPIADNYAGGTYKVHLYDQRGGGLSQRFDPGSPTLSLDQHVEDLRTIVTSYAGGANVRVIAHSWGGALLMAYFKKFGAGGITHAVFISSMAVSDVKQNQIESLNVSIFGTAIADFAWQRNFLGESHAELDFRFLNFLSAQPYYYCSDNDYKKIPYWRFGFVSVIKSMENGMLEGPPVGTSIKYKYDFKASNAAVTGLTKVRAIYGSCDRALGQAVQEELKGTFTAGSPDTCAVNSAGHYTWIDNLSATLGCITGGL